MPVPDRMRFIDVTGKGGPEVLALAEGPVPQPGEGEVLIAVAAAGVNRPDVLQRQGKYPPPPGAPDILGLEVAGDGRACGRGVTLARSATRCARWSPGGGYAEYCVAPAPQCLPVPQRLSAWSRRRRCPRPSSPSGPTCSSAAGCSRARRLLVHGGTSGIGTTAIQLAEAFGARVFATAGTAEKCAACEKLGAERAINYRTEDFVAVVKEADRRARRRRDPRHGRRRLYRRAISSALRDRGPAGADRVPAGRQDARSTFR